MIPSIPPSAGVVDLWRLTRSYAMEYCKEIEFAVQNAATRANVRQAYVNLIEFIKLPEHDFFVRASEIEVDDLNDVLLMFCYLRWRGTYVVDLDNAKAMFNAPGHMFYHFMLLHKLLLMENATVLLHSSVELRSFVRDFKQHPSHERVLGWFSPCMTLSWILKQPKEKFVRVSLLTHMTSHFPEFDRICDQLSLPCGRESGLGQLKNATKRAVKPVTKSAPIPMTQTSLDSERGSQMFATTYGQFANGFVPDHASFPDRSVSYPVGTIREPSKKKTKLRSVELDTIKEELTSVQKRSNMTSAQAVQLLRKVS